MGSDPVLTYINILTNNTGGLNSYVNYSKNNSITVLDVKAYKMKLSNGQVCVDTSQDVSPSVVVSPTQGGSNVKYSFTAGPGDDYVSETEGTFSIVHVEYGWKIGNKNEVQCVLDIPVYVEKRLKVYSNMKMMEGIRYHTETLKISGVSVATDATDPQFTSITKGNSYSIYSEYIYVDSEKFSSVTIPKSF